MPAQKLLAIFHAQITPRAHILRLFLHPHHRSAFRVKSKHLVQQRFVERIELLKPNDRNVVAFQLVAFPGHTYYRTLREKLGWGGRVRRE